MRELRDCSPDRFAALVSKAATTAAQEGKARYVGFESVNTATNVGPTTWNMKQGWWPSGLWASFPPATRPWSSFRTSRATRRTWAGSCNRTTSARCRRSG